jgi:hypothetical protein
MARISRELERYRAAKKAAAEAERALHDAALALVERIEEDHPAIRRRQSARPRPSRVTKKRTPRPEASS